jgi:hypothetical protein
VPVRRPHEHPAGGQARSEAIGEGVDRGED